MSSFDQYLQGAETRINTDEAAAAGNWDEHATGMQQQRQQGLTASLQVMMQGGDPLRETRPIGASIDAALELDRRLYHMGQKAAAKRQILKDNNWDDIRGFIDEMADTYKVRQEAMKVKNPESVEDKMEWMRQLAPVVADPNRVADVRQMAVKLDQAMKAHDPKTSFWTDPQTRKYADWLNREADQGGFFQSGDQKARSTWENPLVNPIMNFVSMGAAEASSGASEFGLNLIYGAYDLADQGVRALGGPSITPPQNYMTTSDGRIVANDAKVTDMVDMMSKLWAASTNQNVQEFASRVDAARELEAASRNGFETITLGASRVAGMGFGFGLPAGVAMNAGARSFGALTTKGLQLLGTSGTSRATKIIKTMGGIGGAGVGQGVIESVAFGKAEGYGNAFLHGMGMAPVLIGLGAMGKRVEWFANKRMKMPEKVAAQIGAAMEGVGFGAMEAGTLPFLPAAWDFIKNPSEETWQTYAKNILGFMLFKGATRRSVSPGQEALAGAVFQARRGQARAQYAEKLAKGEVTPEQAREKGLEPEQLIAIAEATRKGREAKTPEEMTQAAEERRRVEAEADVVELGLGEQVELEMRRIEGEEAEGRPEPEPRPEPEVEIPRVLGPAKPRHPKRLSPEAEKEIGRTLLRKEPLELGPKKEGPLGDVARQQELFRQEQIRAQLRGEEPPMPREVEARGEQGLPTEAVRPEVVPEQPIRQSDIILEMEGRAGRKGFRIPFTAKRIGGKPGDVVQMAIRGGLIGRKGVTGIYRIFENLSRTEDGRNVVDNSHEWSHSMHRRVLGEAGEGMIKAADKQFREAMREEPTLRDDVAEILKDYEGAEKLPPARQWMEAWALWHSRNLLGEAGLDAKLPALGRYMRRWLAAPEQAPLRDQYQRIQGMLWKFNYGMDADALVGTSIVHGGEMTPSERIAKPSRRERARDAILKGFFDDLYSMKRSQDKWLEAIGKSPEDVNIMDDPARLLDTTRMTARKTIEHYVKRGIRQPDGSRIPGLEEILRDIGDRGFEFEKFLVAQKNIELYRKGKKTQHPVQVYMEARRKYVRENRDFIPKARQFKAWTDALVDYVARSGGLPKEEADKIKAAYVVYVPFFRALDAQGRGPTGAQIGGKAMRRIEGSALEVRDPLKAITDVATQMVAKAHQNIVMSALYKFAAGQEAGGVASVVPRKAVPSEHPVKQILDAMERQIELKGDEQHGFEDIITALRNADALSEQTVSLFTQQVAPPGDKNIIAFTPRLSEAEISRIAIDPTHKKLLESQQGKVQWLEVDRSVYEALMGIDKVPTAQWLDKPVIRTIVGGSTGLVRLFATGVSPGFMLANIARDVLSQPMFNAEGKIRPLGGLLKWFQGASEYFHRGGEIRELYDELGVRTSSFFREGHVRNLMGQHTTLMQKSKHALSTVMDKVQDFFAGPENFLRIKEFKDAYEKAHAENKSEMEARLLALEAGREITVNFARAGVIARGINQMVPYFNASLQGQRKLWRQIAIGGDAKSDVARARIQRAAIANGLLNITSFSALAWWMGHDQEWYQDLPQWRKIHYFNFKFGDQIISLPKPFEAGILFGTIPEALLDAAFAEGGRPPSPGSIAKNLFLGYLDGPAALIPAFARPAIELQANRNFFTGRPLTPEWVAKSRIPAEQMTTYTTESAKWLAGVLSSAVGGAVTPIQVEHFLGAHTAGATTSAFRALDELTGLKDHPSFSMNPTLRFTRQETHGQSRFVDDLYTMSTGLDQRAGSDLLAPGEDRLKIRVDQAKRQISALRKSYKQGRITRQEQNRRSYEIARPLVEEGER